MSQDPSPRVVVTREKTQRDNPEIVMRPPAEDSPMKRFEATWSDQERADELKDWRRERVGQYIQALSESLERMFSSLDDASCKTLVSLSLDMKAAGLERLEFKTEFSGSYFGAQSESYAGVVELTGPSAAKPAGEGERVVVERELAAATGEAPEPAERLGKIWADPQGCLALYDQLRLAFGDEDGTKTAGRTAFLLMHLELLSQRRSESSSVELKGLTEGPAPDSDGIGARVECARRESGPNSPAAKRRM